MLFEIKTPQLLARGVRGGCIRVAMLSRLRTVHSQCEDWSATEEQRSFENVQKSKRSQST
jgi:hypothetical protein